MKIKAIVHRLFDEIHGNQKGDLVVHYFISGLIVLNVIIIFLQSYQSLADSYRMSFYAFELFSVLVFTLEYFIRIWIADLEHPNLSPTKARIKYMVSLMGIIDLLAILPFYIPFLIKVDLRVLRMLRLLRLFRIFKLNRHSKALSLVIEVFKKTKNDILVTVSIVAVLLVIAATIMYDIEKQAQPDAFANIGEAMWWSVATLTTVGYGDIYPITGLGKFLSGVIALLGIGIVALPTGIISSAYIEEIQKNNRTQCPHCGKTH